jgi:hypothetical protein
MRPASIVNFERLYVGAIIVGLVNTYLSWDKSLAMLRSQPVQVGSGFLIGTTAFGLAIQLLLWFFIARRGSVVAKWLLVVLFALGILLLIVALVRNPAIGGVTGVLALVNYALQAAAVWMLFRPDSKAWLG